MEAIVQVLMSLALVAAMFGAAFSGARGRAWPGGCLVALSVSMGGSLLAGAPVLGTLTVSVAVVVLSGAVVWGVGFFGLRSHSPAVMGGRS